MCKAGRLKKVLEVFQNLLIKGSRPNVFIYNIIINRLCKEDLLDDGA